MPKKLQTHRYRARLLPSTMSKNSKNIERTLFLWLKIKTRTLTKNVKIDPQEYVYQGSPYNAYKNTKYKRKKKTSENRRTEKRLSGGPTIMPIKTPKNI